MKLHPTIDLVAAVMLVTISMWLTCFIVSVFTTLTFEHWNPLLWPAIIRTTLGFCWVIINFSLLVSATSKD